MEYMDVRRLGLILAIQAEIEAMKAENEIRKYNSEVIVYGLQEFQAKAEELRNFSYCDDTQL